MPNYTMYYLQYKVRGEVSITELIVGLIIVLIGLTGSTSAVAHSIYEFLTQDTFSPPCYMNNFGPTSQEQEDRLLQIQ